LDGILAAEANRTGEPGAVLDHINASLEYYTCRNRLNTALCYVMLSQEKRDGQTTFRVNAANAGGISPLVRRADGRVEWLDVRGLPLGIANANETSYAPQRTELQSGDLLVLTSDGVVEAMNAARQIFSFERFERAVAESKPVSSAASVREEILSKMRAFGAGVPPHDDVTLVVIRVV
jgi:serine phosphatase RsbU (regulator of sigma subunit)